MVRGKKRATLAIVGLALLGLIGTWHYRLPFAAWAIRSIFEQKGLGPVQIVVDEVGVREFAAHDLSLRGGAIHASQVKAIYNPFDLPDAHLKRVTLMGLKISMSGGTNGIEIGGRPLELRASSNGYATGLRIDALEMADAQIAFESSTGEIEAKFATKLALTDTAIQSNVFSGRFTAPILGKTYTTQIEAQELALELHSSGGTRLRISQARLSPMDIPWAAQGIDGEINWQADRATAKLSVGRLVNRRDPQLVAPLALTANATLVGPNVDFILDVFADTKPVSKLEVKGRHDLSADSGSATISMQPIEFRKGGLQPVNIIPAFDGRMENARGTVAVAGSFRWDHAGLSPNLLVHVEDFDFNTSTAQFRGLTGTVRLLRLWPPATAIGQMLSVTVAAGGLPPAKVWLQGELTSAPTLKIERAEIDVAGGQLTSTPFVIEPGELQLATTVTVNGVDLAEIIKLLSAASLSGTGQLDGKIPLELKNGKILVDGGRLAARGRGVLRYKPDKVPDEIASAGDSVALAMQALSDFHYESLSLDLDKAPSGEGTVLLRLKGSNPAVMDNQAFDFKIRIDSNFDRLIDLALLSLNSAEELLRKASGGNRP